ncbi:hypothetical protein DL95DRAFT_156637 [Leptodontidium sp. 2 PMI_412]|nr:hypothetical protein DL95DRAFT_156637 [Leptodontidium sp. 2 PMI_412]
MSGINHSIGVPLDSDSDTGSDLISTDGSALRLPEFFEQLQLQQQASGDNSILLRKSKGKDIAVETHACDKEKHEKHDARTWDKLPKERKGG